MKPLSSLTNRIFLGSVVLIVVSIAVAGSRVGVTVGARAEQDLRARLDEASALVAEYTRAQFADFVVKGTLIADLPVLKNAAATDHPPTVQPIALDYQRRIGADVFVVLGRTRRLLANAGRVRPDDAEVAAMLDASTGSPDGAAFWPLGDGVVHVAAVPMEPGPSPVGTLIVGFSLDREAAARLRDVTHSDIVFVAGRRVVASTRPDLPAEAFADLVPGSEVVLQPTADDELIGRVQPLGAASAGEPVAVVLRSRAEQLRVLRQIRSQIIVTGLVAVGVATLLGYGIARTVTRPLRAVTATMREMATTGDLTRAVPPVGRWDDEDARLLASTFGQLTGALDRFRREAAQRERLSSLGRLSTVVAHEVRNPLMIIKAAARRLRRHDAPEVTVAAQDIDEEVERLNRVVTGVLDFARPIAFDLAPADALAICRDACEATDVATGDVPVTLQAPPGPCTLITDAERLRLALVNLLTNAQDAVRDAAARGAAVASPPVTLRLRHDEDVVRIDIEDRGAGIAPDHLPRLFEPFFTTKRTGSGLGLALVRNIIEGLGGTIEAAPRPGGGTTMRLRLPARPPREEQRT
ncbi:MAG: HAMP domain-containing sensor histidine kinase [Vicinamibacterales bacterium]